MADTSLSASNQDVFDIQPRHCIDHDTQEQHTVNTVPAISPSGEEQALESHEVIELQSFSERKAWIEEKIKFLEALPPIEVFIGLDTIRSSAEDIPGLPTRLELEQWMTEHDVIEKETEIFDKGELKKLRQLTKAATQRNLSPEDTDVIELTLTTIYALDKLLHLLRDRSENLEMMSIRLSWEENRRTAWIEQRQIIEDLHAFAVNRARWNASIYELSSAVEDSNGPARRGSIASQASASSDSIISSSAFSRSTRFRLAEMLSRDAAQFSGRVTSLRHGQVAAAGKALDRLIDQSRKPVPDELLDEQDRLEEKCINEMENVTKFAMNLVMQWRKADEIYVETKKDHIAALNLLEEIEMAQLNHPTARQSTSFTSRADTIVKRLAIRGDPLSPGSLFPRPEHFLFPDQKLANEKLIKALSDDIAAANKLSIAANASSKEYKNSYEGVRQVETLLQNVGQVITNISAVVQKFQEGIPGEAEDGSPPNLTSELCLDPSYHALFIALFPSLLEETAKTIDAADQHLRAGPSLLLALDSPGIDVHFKENAAANLVKLSLLRNQVIGIRESSTKQLARLRDSRKIANNINSQLTLLKTTKIQMVDLMERDRWRQQFGSMDAPPTPESPTSELPPSQSSCLEFEERLSAISATMDVDITQPLQDLAANLESNLHAFLISRTTALERSLEDGHRLLRLLGGIRKQSSAMAIVRDDFHGIMTQVEDARIQVTGMVEEILDPKPENTAFTLELGNPDAVDIGSKYLEPIQRQATAFVDSLSKRVPFVAQYSAPTSNRTSSLKSPSLPNNLQARVSNETAVIPFDLPTLDSIVRADSNSYASRINGSVETLIQQKGHFDLAIIARATDSAMSAITTDMNSITQALSGQKTLFAKVPRQADDTVHCLREMLDSLGTIRFQHAETTQSLSLIRGSMEIIDETSKNLAISIREDIYKPRNTLFRTIENRSSQLQREMAELQDVVEQAIKLEHIHWEELKAAQIRQAKELEERLAAEEAARIQMELQSALEEERQRALEKQLAEQRQQEETRQRQLIELAEKQRAEQEAVEAEKRRLEGLEQQAEAARFAKAEAQRVQEEADRIRLEQGRLDALEKLRLIEVQLEEERRLHAERELAAANLANRQQSEMDELTKRQVEMELLAKESAHQAQMERNGKQRMEKEVKEHEEHFMRQYSELQQLVEDQARLADIERSEKERAEKEAKGYAAALTERHMRDLLLAEENARQLEFALTEKEQAEMEARELAKELEEQRRVYGNNNQDVEQTKADEHLAHISEDDQDVFGILKSPAASTSSNSEDLTHLQRQVLALRKRLRSICMDEVLSPSKASAQLPTEVQFQKIEDDLQTVSRKVSMLPIDTSNGNLNAELKALRDEVLQSQLSLRKIQELVHMSTSIQYCDSALSDLLEHIDSYPNAPLLTVSAHKSLPTTSPEEQMADRLAFTEGLVENMDSKFEVVSNDPRAISEHSRINRTWTELREMASDRVNGRKSRPASVISGASSSGNKNVSTNAGPLSRTRAAKKTSSYSNLSVSSVPSSSKGKMLAPPVPPTKARRAVSNANESISRSTSRASSISTSTTRSVSGPLKKGTVKPSEMVARSSSRLSSTSTTRSVSGPLNSSLYGTTFSSRQRTTSLSATVSTPPQQSSLTPSRFRMNSETKRGISPAISETSSYSHSHSSRGPRSSINASTWSRAPRNSLSSLLPRVATPPKKIAPSVRKEYVADPRNKLDVAVGDVVNQLEVGINIESISESWRDQSGKYWIGNQDPKLCFCRILRSQTVMVRVGGGWTELSKFIKDHFADSFRIAPGLESPPRPGSQTERWISSAMLLEARESLSPPRAPQTPEPNPTFLPSFALVTPSEQSPKSIKSLSPPSLRSSPLTPLQFMRRAEPGPDVSLLQPAVTPSKTLLRGRISTSNTPARTSVWRP